MCSQANGERCWSNSSGTTIPLARSVSTALSRQTVFQSTIDLEQIAALWGRDDIALRERVFWRLLYDTAGPRQRDLVASQ